jgi:hypothetical protein
VLVVVDIANVMGSRPDGWWRDRAGAATKLLAGMPRLVGRTVPGPNGEPVSLDRIVAITEGAANDATAPEGVVVVRAPKDGDSTIVTSSRRFVDDGSQVLVVTADGGLRARLGDDVLVAGPGWLNDLLGR